MRGGAQIRRGFRNRPWSGFDWPEQVKNHSPFRRAVLAIRNFGRTAHFNVGNRLGRRGKRQPESMTGFQPAKTGSLPEFL